jgi:hypothetical protein
MMGDLIIEYEPTKRATSQERAGRIVPPIQIYGTEEPAIA